MPIKKEILYATIIADFVKRESLSKPQVLKIFDEVANIFLNKGKKLAVFMSVERYRDTASYKKDLDEIANTLIEIDIPKPIAMVFVDVCRKKDFKLLLKTQNILLRRWGLSRIKVVSSYKIDQSYKDALSKEILSGMPDVVEVSYQYSPALIGGDVILVNNFKIDNSALGRLQKLEDTLLS